jgi:hypothetical protein
MYKPDPFIEAVKSGRGSNILEEAARDMRRSPSWTGVADSYVGEHCRGMRRSYRARPWTERANLFHGEIVTP